MSSARKKVGSEARSSPALREVLDRVGDKWSVLVIAFLGSGGKRFSELRRSIDGISQRMLTLTLRELERDGLVVRVPYATIPPRVDYQLTPFGRSLLGPVNSLVRWAEDNLVAIRDARDRHDASPPDSVRDVD